MCRDSTGGLDLPRSSEARTNYFGRNTGKVFTFPFTVCICRYLLYKLQIYSECIERNQDRVFFM